MASTDTRLGHEQLRHDATHDALTHLANRRELVERATEILSHPPRPDVQVAVAFIDVHGLKAANDSLGHLVGDHLIVTIAHRIRSHMRANDIVARFGGDEFVVLLPEVTSGEAAVDVADHIRRELSTPVEIDGVVLAVSASVGVTLVAPGEHVATVLERADAAMYEAKRTGGDRTVCLLGEPVMPAS